MIHKVSLLLPHSRDQIQSAYKMYTRMDTTEEDQLEFKKKAFSVDVKIEFLAIWCVNGAHVVFVAGY